MEFISRGEGFGAAVAGDSEFSPAMAGKISCPAALTSPIFRPGALGTAMNLPAPDAGLIIGLSPLFACASGGLKKTLYQPCEPIIRLTAKPALKYLFTEWIFFNQCFIESAVDFCSAMLWHESDSAPTGRWNLGLKLLTRKVPP